MVIVDPMVPQQDFVGDAPYPSRGIEHLVGLAKFNLAA